MEPILIIKPATSEEHVEVQKKLFSEGYVWCGTGKTIKHYGTDLISVYSDKDMSCDGEEYCRIKYPNIPITSGKEYLGKGIVTTKFKVGDKVKLIKSNHYSEDDDLEVGEIYTIRAFSSENGKVFIETEEGRYHLWISLDQFKPADKKEYLKETVSYGMDSKTIEKITKSLISKTMTNIVKFAKDMKLSADEKLLRKHGLKDEDGYTDEAEEIITAKLLKENESYLLEIAKAKEAEEK